MVERYIECMDNFMVWVTLYYIINTGFYFLMWFFKRPISEVIEDLGLQWKLQLCYWCGFAMNHIHYAFVYNNVPDREYQILYVFNVLGLLGYAILVFLPLISMIRDRIPEHRGH